MSFAQMQFINLVQKHKRFFRQYNILLYQAIKSEWYYDRSWDRDIFVQNISAPNLF